MPIESKRRATCSICQSTIDADEPRTACDACGLPFHTDCWSENFGCSAYGCSNVNALKPGPDFSIPNPPPLAAFHSSFGAPRPVAPPAIRPSADDGIPWEFALLAGCALVSLLGALLYGVLALLGLAGVVVYNVSRQDRVQVNILIACYVVCGLGFLFGIIVSVLFWW